MKRAKNKEQESNPLDSNATSQRHPQGQTTEFPPPSMLWHGAVASPCYPEQGSRLASVSPHALDCSSYYTTNTTAVVPQVLRLLGRDVDPNASMRNVSKTRRLIGSDLLVFDPCSTPQLHRSFQCLFRRAIASAFSLSAPLGWARAPNPGCNNSIPAQGVSIIFGGMSTTQRQKREIANRKSKSLNF